MAVKRDRQQKAALAEASPHYRGHRERLRARFRDAGAEAVSDYELLELVLFRAIPQRDVKPLAKELIAKFGSFAETVAAPMARLKEVKGLGEAAITEMKIVQAAANRLARGQVRKQTVLSSWSSVLDYCRASMARRRSTGCACRGTARGIALCRRRARQWHCARRADSPSATYRTAPQ